MKWIYITLCCLVSFPIFSQGFRRVFPKTVFTGQYAGSTGLYTFGASVVTPRNHIELGLLYGRLPRAFGGLNQSLSIKFTYNPFRIPIGNRILFEPLQTGLFVCQNFNENSGILWGDNYPKLYYWWARSTRVHPFFGTQVSWRVDGKYLDRIGIYAEANTNDLYFSSYIENRKALSPYDIFFLGAGLKVYLK